MGRKKFVFLSVLAYLVLPEACTLQPLPWHEYLVCSCEFSTFLGDWGLSVSCGCIYFDNQKRYVPLNPFQWGNGNTDWGCDNFAAQVCAETHAGSVCVVLSLKDLVSCGQNKPCVARSDFRRAPPVQDSFSLSVAEGKTDFNASNVKRLLRRLFLCSENPWDHFSCLRLLQVVSSSRGTAQSQCFARFALLCTISFNS